MKKNILSRIISIILAILLVMTLIPVDTVFAFDNNIGKSCDTVEEIDNQAFKDTTISEQLVSSAQFIPVEGEGALEPLEGRQMNDSEEMVSNADEEVFFEDAIAEDIDAALAESEEDIPDPGEEDIEADNADNDIVESQIADTPVSEEQIVSAGGDFQYKEESDGTITITKYVGTESSLVVPGTIDGKTVTKIGESVFASNKGLTKVSLPSSLKKIGTSAFENTGLTSIVLPQGLEELGYKAFTNTGIKEVTIPKTLVKAYRTNTSFGLSGGPFAGETLQAITFENGIGKVPGNLCDGCSSLKTVNMVTTITGIEENAFSGCTALTKINLPSSLKKIGTSAFENTGLTSIVLPQGLEELGYKAFTNTGITEVTIPKTLVKAYRTNTSFGLSGGPFAGETLQAITFENGIGKVPGNLCDGCSSLKTVNMVTTITEIEENAFSGCTALTKINLPSSLKKIGTSAFENTGLTSIVLPQGLEELGYKAFTNTGITEVTIPKTLVKAYRTNTSFGLSGGPFAGETLQAITFENGIGKVPGNLCDGCSSLKTVNMVTTITEIEENAFSGCTALTKINLPSSLKKIGTSAFENTGLTSIVLPQGLEELGYKAFTNTGITEVTIPKTLVKAYRTNTSFGLSGGPFAGDVLEKITFENGIKIIPANVCAGCTSLTNVTIPESVIRIENNAFRGCLELESVTVLSKDCEIQNDAFLDCNKVRIACNYRSRAVIYAINNDVPFNSIPQTGTYNASALNLAQSAYYLNSKSVTTNGAMLFHAICGIKPAMAGKISNAKIVLYVSRNTKWLEDTVKIGGTSSSDYSYDERTRRIILPLSAGDTNVEVTFGAVEQYRDYIKSYAFLQYNLNGETKVEVINAINEKFSDISISAADTVNKADVPVSGVGPVSQTIDLYLDDVKINSVTSKKNGSWSDTITLNNPVNYQSYQITAKTINEYGEEVEVSTMVMYQEDAPELLSIVMEYEEHDTKKQQEIYDTKDKKPVVYYWPNSPFSFYVTFDNTAIIDKVYVTSTRNNVKKEMEAVYDPATGKYTASGFFDDADHRYVPGTIGVEYVTKTKKMDDSLPDTISKAALKLQKQAGITVQGKKESDHYSEASIDISPLVGAANEILVDVAVTHYENLTGTEVSELLGFKSDVLDMAPYFIEGLNDSKYIVNIEDNLKGKESSDVVLTVLEFADDSAHLVKSATKLYMSSFADSDWVKAFELNEKISTGTMAIDSLYKMYKVRSEYDDLVREIEESDTIKDKSTARRQAAELRDDKMIFTAAMLLLPLLVAGSPMAGAMAVFSGLTIFMKASADMIYDGRERGILSGRGRLQFVVDPSGFIYDTATDERLENVTVSAYYVPYDESDDFWDRKPSVTEYGTLWGAVDYEQENPLMTDKEGRYQWDVPEGWWRVKAEKEGYETTWSEWLPVPPIQTDVNLGLQPVITNIEKMTIALSAASYTYNGKAKKPTVTVGYSTVTLVSGTDYTCTYKNNTNAGTATVIITGKGSYSGSVTKTFKINKAAAKLSFAEASVTKSVQDESFANELSKTTDGSVSFTSSDTKVATVDSTSGLVTLQGAGTATITATAAEGKNYKAGSAAYSLTVEAPEPTAAPTPTPAVSGFSDVQDPNHAFYKPIYWAADAGITKGYPDGTFGIDRSCTRGEMIMFLWRYSGKPAAKAVTKSPFSDVPKTHSFYNAILWGSQKGITKGYPDGTFGINRNVSRGECMMFLWRLRGKPAPKAVSVSPFKDVPKNHAFYNAILWGAQKKITNGYTSGPKKGTFGINENCTRGAIVTFLYRAR